MFFLLCRSLFFLGPHYSFYVLKMLYGLRMTSDIRLFFFPFSHFEYSNPNKTKAKTKDKRISLIFAFLRIQQIQRARAFIALSPRLISNQTKTRKKEKKCHTKRKAHTKKPALKFQTTLPSPPFHNPPNRK